MENGQNGDAKREKVNPAGEKQGKEKYEKERHERDEREQEKREGKNSEKEKRGQRKRRKTKAVSVSRIPQREVKINDTVSSLSVPDEVLRACPVMTVLGRQEITVEGHGGILAYETDCIRIRTGNTVISVVGSKLVIDYYNDEELKIIGCIDQISWEGRFGGMDGQRK